MNASWTLFAQGIQDLSSEQLTNPARYSVSGTGGSFATISIVEAADNAVIIIATVTADVDGVFAWTSGNLTSGNYAWTALQSYPSGPGYPLVRSWGTVGELSFTVLPVQDPPEWDGYRPSGTNTYLLTIIGNPFATGKAYNNGVLGATVTLDESGVSEQITIDLEVGENVITMTQEDGRGVSAFGDVETVTVADT